MFCVIGLIALFFILNLIFPLKVELNYSTIVTDSDGKVIHAFLNSNEKWRMKTELNEITPQLRKAIIAKEDQYFYYHFGVNPLAIMRAAVNNVFHLRRTSGASTITMQVARMLEPKERTVFSKVKEIFRAFQLEWYYSKDEILQMYLNLVPYGSNIEGVKSASIIFFQQSPQHLSLAQTVTLAIIPNRPTSLQLGKKNYYIRKERNRWLENFRDEKIFGEEEIKDAEAEPLDVKRHEVPQQIPQLAVRLKKNYPLLDIIHTNIHSSVQSKTQTLAYNYLQRVKNFGVYNCAVMVIDNKMKTVVAYLGSADMSDGFHNGMVDGVKAIRSPGSTLKPFLYALAIDKGLMTPKTIITDVHVNFNGYNPENYDEKFRGNVSIEYALANSLNIPAVKTLNDVGVKYFVQKLQQAGFRQMNKDGNKLGLSSILGGCGVRLEELVALFSSFATDGNFCAPQLVKEDSVQLHQQLFSASSAFMITDILSGLARPDLPLQYQNSLHLPKIAWKTGTSYGRRDAWSIGYNKRYTIGVWIGNFTGEGVPELSGAEVATPLLFDLFNAIDYNSSNEWFTMPKEMNIRYVCSQSGLSPNDFCSDAVMDYFIPGISPNQKCDHEKTVFVLPDESISYCMSCVPDVGYKKKLYPNLTPDLIDFYESQNIPYEKIPPHNPKCSRVFSSTAPKIISPSDGVEYILEKKGNNQVALSCQAGNDVKKVYWYVNDKFFKEAEATEKIFFIPPAGKVKVSCTDDKGVNADVMITVSYLN